MTTTDTTTDVLVEEKQTPQNVTGRLIVQYLQENEAGATVSQIKHHLQSQGKEVSEDLDKDVENILENGTILGFLHRKGSQYVHWVARGPAGKRRRIGRLGQRKRSRASRRRVCPSPKRRRRNYHRRSWRQPLPDPKPRQGSKTKRKKAQ